MIVINTAKAIEVTKELIRTWRESEFKKNDEAIQNALVDGLDTTDLLTRRNFLRDLPNSCEGKTLEELKEILKNLS